MLKVIHITADDKFFDGPIRRFESDPSLENIAYLTSFGTKKLKYIKSVEKINVLRSKSDLKQILEEGNYDVVFFYSLPFERWWMVETIPADKKIIWWEWGFELYGHRGGLEPLIDIPLYKPLTKKYVTLRLRTWVAKSVNYFLYRHKKKGLLEQRKRVLSRIDYLMPVLPIDYDLLKKYPVFRAQTFHYRLEEAIYKFNINLRMAQGGILLGNSSLVSNNHLDIWEELKETGITGRKIVVPLSYGEFDTAAHISKKIKSDYNEVIVLRKFMTQKDYFNLIDNCSYAIFGVLRQQAVGNIKHCIRLGIKVFLYKDSVCYKSLTASGYKVFAIENMDLMALSTPMTIEDNKHNQEVFLDEVSKKNEVYDKVMKEIKDGLSKL